MYAKGTKVYNKHYGYGVVCESVNTQDNGAYTLFFDRVSLSKRLTYAHTVVKYNLSLHKKYLKINNKSMHIYTDFIADSKYIDTIVVPIEKYDEFKKALQRFLIASVKFRAIGALDAI